MDSTDGATARETQTDTGEYDALYRHSLDDPESFWLTAARAVKWIQPPKRALDDSDAPLYRWFPGARLNTCYNAVDRHVIEGRADDVALIHDSAVTGEVTTYTYSRLLEQVAQAAGVLQALGVEKGDRVIIYLPMIPEAVITMLACARIGAVHSVVFGGFAASELAARIDDAQPKVVVTASCGVERTRIVEYKPIVDAALNRAEHQVAHCIVVQRPQCEAPLTDRDFEWAAVMKPGGVQPAGCVSVEATDPLYILYTSGTTGRPKGIVRDNGGHAVALTWSMSHIYGMNPGDVWFTASDVGWVVGHSYIVYAPLFAGLTTVMYEGKPVGTPDAGAFWRIVEQHRVNGLFTAPTAIRAIKKEDPDAALLAQHDISSLRTLFLAGERLDPDTYTWAHEKLRVPVVDNWWQTETGWPIVADPVGIEMFEPKPGSATKPSPGFDVRVLGPDGTELPAGEEGALCVKLPLPPGTLPTLWQDDERYVSSYLSAFPGYYLSGDGGYLDEDGYVWVMGRTDDVLNVAGHRLSTGALEAALAGHPAVAECAVIGVADPLKGQVPRALVVLKAGREYTDDELAALADELKNRVRDEVGALAALQQVDVVQALPKTRSGKILRKTMRQLADGQQPQIPGTIEDIAVLDQLTPMLQSDSASPRPVQP